MKKKECELEQIAIDAGKALTESKVFLEQASMAFENHDNFSEIDDKARALQLILQYRLDTQDALVQLVQINQSILNILGIDSHQSSKVNIERIAFALGHDDLSHLLHALSELLDLLLRMAYRAEQAKEHHFKEGASHKKTKNSKNGVFAVLNQAKEKQKEFISNLERLNHNLMQLTKRAAVGPVLDHVQAIRGPVSQFFQSMQNGMSLSHGLYTKVYQDGLFGASLTTILNQAKHVVGQVPSTYQKKGAMFTAKKSISTDTLERRAARKRMRHFFS